jgi:uncharacterized membrane protein (DUF2068 family)
MQTEAIEGGGSKRGARAAMSVPERRTHDRGLLLIGLFKLGKALFFMAIGAGALHFIRKDLGDTILRLATALGRDPEGRFVSVVMAQVDMLDHHKLREISMASFGYSVVSLTEGVGLVLEKAWAEYLTLCLTISFLPWEVYELVRRASWTRFGLLVINLLVLGYILLLLRHKRRNEAN